MLVLNHEIDLLRRVVAIDTNVMESKNYKKMAILLEKELENIGARVEIIYAEEKDGRSRPNVIGYIDNGKDETLALNAHYDVVPVALDEWKTNPFELSIKGNKAFGRGAADTKSGVVAAIYAAKNARSRVNLELMFTCDEEIGGELGLGWVMKNRRDKVLSNSAVIIDARRKITIGASGGASGKIIVTGKEAHSGYPFLGKNAITTSLLFLNKIQQFEKVAAMDVSKYGNGDRKVYGRFNITMLHSGIKDTIIPGRLEATFSIRSIPEIPVATLVKKFEGYFASTVKEFKIDAQLAEVKLHQDGYLTNPRSSIVRNMIRAAGSKELYGAFGGDDGIYFHRAGIPVVSYGALNQSAHKSNEYVNLNEFKQVRDTLVKLLEDFRTDTIITNKASQIGV